MWGLDRLSASSAASPAPHRTGSPAALRASSPFHAPRPGLNPRSSSLTVASVPSTPPASSPGRTHVASSLKNQISNAPPPDVEDPLDALNRIVGARVPARSTETDVLEAPPDLEGEIDFGSGGLEDFVKAAPDSYGTIKSVAEFEKDRNAFEDLHKSIQRCNDILGSIGDYLSDFQTHLGSVSSEIETLQSKSTAMNNKLSSRQKLEETLRPIVAQLTLSPQAVHLIIEGPINDAWSAALEEVQGKIKLVDSNKLGDVQAFADLRPLLDDLANKAVERIRDYFAAKIKALRAPNMNAQVLQQRDFLPRKSLFAFLAARQPQLAEDISRAYTHTMRWYYHANFARYEGALRKLRLYNVDKSDLLGEDPLSRSSTASSSNKAPGHQPLSLGRRGDSIRRAPSSALPSSTAEESKTPTYIETPFLFFNLALLDNACFEYSFLTTFQPAGTALAQPRAVARQFDEIFQPALEVGQGLTRQLVVDSCDALGILLMVRLTQHFAFVSQRRKVPTLEGYINGANMQLWPRFQAVLDAHCDSLKRLAAAVPGRGASSGLGGAATLASLSGSGTNPGPSTAPHPVTQRFAQLLQGILELSSEAGDDEPVAHSLRRLRGDFEGVLQKMAGAFGAGERGRRERERFLNNNASLVLTILADVGGVLADESRAQLQRLVVTRA